MSLPDNHAKRAHLRIIRTAELRPWQKLLRRVGPHVLAITAFALIYPYTPEAFKLTIQSKIRAVGSAIATSAKRGISAGPCNHTDLECVNGLFARQIVPGQVAPAFQQIYKFLAQTKTSKHPYVMPSFICHEFAQSLNMEAQQAKIPVLYAHVNFSDWPTAHALSAFPSKPGEWFYFDSTSDQKSLVKLRVGGRPIYYPNFTETDVEKSYDVALRETEKKLDGGPYVDLTMGTVGSVLLKPVSAQDLEPETLAWIQKSVGAVR